MLGTHCVVLQVENLLSAANYKSELESLSILDDVVVIESFCIPYLLLLGVEKLLIKVEL